MLREAALTAERDGQDPIDAAVLAALGGRRPDGCELLGFEPFDADRKRAEARVREAGAGEYRVAKGAIQAILDLVGKHAAGADRVAEATADFAAGGSGR